MGAFLFLLLLFIPPLLAMKSENTPSRSFDGGWRVSKDEDDIITDPAYSSLECNIFHDSDY